MAGKDPSPKAPDRSRETVERIRSRLLGRRRLRSLVVLSAAIVMIAGACSSSKGKSGTPTSSGASTTASGGQPQTGGTLSMGEFSSPAGLDPIIMTGSGTTGLIETEAVYDTLLRYDPKAGTYNPGTALSADPNADGTVWTVKLRPNVKFSDGTPYDADAVVFGINRHRSGQPGAPPCATIIACPKNSVSSAFPASYITNVTAVDPLTVQITLRQSWQGFRAALASEIGLVPSPTALKKDCTDPNAAVAQCSFNLNPVGAGPFMVTSFKPGEGITMVRNPTYWNGPAYLDGLQFTNLGDGGGDKTFGSLQADQLQAAFLRDPQTVAKAHDANVAGFSNFSYGGAIIQMNLANPTASTSMALVRQIVAQGVDPNVINARAYQGKGHTSSQLLQPDFRWYPNVPGPKYDPTAAAALVTQAKAAGWDGKLRILTNNSPTGTNVGLAAQAMLQALPGVTVTLDDSRDIQGATALLVQKNFDTFFGGMAAGNDDTAEIAIAQNFQSGVPSNRVGINDPALDAGIKALFAASTDPEKVAAYKTIETEINSQNPILAIAKIEEFIAWSAKVHGMNPGIKTTVYMDKAWISK
jgi:peptide/nickel transport system substrate-binding protein